MAGIALNKGIPKNRSFWSLGHFRAFAQRAPVQSYEEIEPILPVAFCRSGCRDPCRDSLQGDGLGGRRWDH